MTNTSPTPTLSGPFLSSADTSQVARGSGGRDRRTSKSEPVPRTTAADLLNRRRRTAASSTGAGGGACSGGGGAPFGNYSSGQSESTWARRVDDTNPADRLRGMSAGGQPPQDLLAHLAEQHGGSADNTCWSNVHGGLRAVGGDDTINRLLGNAGVGRVSSLGGGAGRPNDNEGEIGGSMHDELGGESTFLAPHPGNGEELGLGEGKRGGVALLNPRAAADHWSARR